jgi:hypothetical protein
MKFDLPAKTGLGHARVAEIESAITAETGNVLAEEQHLPPLCGFRHRVVIAAVMIAIIGRAGRDNASLKLGI